LLRLHKFNVRPHRWISIRHGVGGNLYVFNSRGTNSYPNNVIVSRAAPVVIRQCKCQPQGNSSNQDIIVAIRAVRLPLRIVYLVVRRKLNILNRIVRR
jgi:hypothetical protein